MRRSAPPSATGGPPCPAGACSASSRAPSPGRKEPRIPDRRREGLTKAVRPPRNIPTTDRIGAVMRHEVDRRSAAIFLLQRGDFAVPLRLQRRHHVALLPQGRDLAVPLQPQGRDLAVPLRRPAPPPGGPTPNLRGGTMRRNPPAQAAFRGEGDLSSASTGVLWSAGKSGGRVAGWRSLPALSAGGAGGWRTSSILAEPRARCEVHRRRAPGTMSRGLLWQWRDAQRRGSSR